LIIQKAPRLNRRVVFCYTNILPLLLSLLLVLVLLFVVVVVIVVVCGGVVW
jgi:hypothetical protein